MKRISDHEEAMQQNSSKRKEKHHHQSSFGDPIDSENILNYISAQTTMKYDDKRLSRHSNMTSGLQSVRSPTPNIAAYATVEV